MQERQRNIGDVQPLNFCGDIRNGIIVRMYRIEDGERKGMLEAYVIDGYGETQDFFFPDGDCENMADRRRTRSMMPTEYISKRAIDFDWTLYEEDMGAIKAIANSFVLKFPEYRRQGRGLYLSSRTKGSGKTLLACCLANEIMRRVDTSVKFITAPDYIELIKDKADSAKEVVKAIKECGLLILDDIGAEADKKNEWVQMAMYRLIDYRDKNMLPTLYTSNFEMDDLPGDERSTDRIVGHSVPVIMPEYSIRRSRAKERTGRFLKNVLSGKEEGIDIFSGNGSADMTSK